jgi:hypothetical protein
MSRILPMCLWVALCLGGCAAAPVSPPEAVIVVPPTALSAAAGEDFVYAAVVRTLRDFSFAVDREDRGSGRVTTRPLPAAAAVEFWRRDSIGWENYAEGSLNRIRRTAAAVIRRTDGGYSIAWFARTRRFADPESATADAGTLLGRFRVGGGGGASQSDERFGDPVGSPGVGGRNRFGDAEEPHGVWVDLGRDHRLERALAARLKESAAVR